MQINELYKKKKTESKFYTSESRAMEINVLKQITLEN